MLTKLKSLESPLLATILFFCLCGAARAHDPGLSAISVRFGTTQVTVHLSIAQADVENALGLKTGSRSGLAGDTVAKHRLEAFGRDAIELTIDDKPLSVQSVETQPDGSGTLVFQIIHDLKPGSRVKIQSHTLSLLARGHRQYLSVVDGQGNKLGEKVLDAGNCEFEVELSSTIRANMLFQFVALGIEHILTGYDHLVFLLGLLIAGAGFKDIAKIITSFTVAHSITLALSTLDLARISSSIVEPLIAISIVYVGLENIIRRNLKWRWLLTFGFGMIHGFGFASALRDVGIGSGSAAALPLISFNAGVELGQLSVAAVALPIIWTLRKRQMFVARFAPACSLIISFAGAVWFVERLSG